MAVMLTTPEAAKRIGCTRSQLREVYRKGHLPPVPRAGLTRLIAEKDLPRIKRKLIELGWMKEAANAAA